MLSIVLILVCLDLSTGLQPNLTTNWSQITSETTEIYINRNFYNDARKFHNLMVHIVTRGDPLKNKNPSIKYLEDQIAMLTRKEAQMEKFIKHEKHKHFLRKMMKSYNKMEILPSLSQLIRSALKKDKQPNGEKAMAGISNSHYRYLTSNAPGMGYQNETNIDKTVADIYNFIRNRREARNTHIHKRFPQGKNYFYFTRMLTYKPMRNSLSYNYKDEATSLTNSTNATMSATPAPKAIICDTTSSIEHIPVAAPARNIFDSQLHWPLNRLAQKNGLYKMLVRESNRVQPHDWPIPSRNRGFIRHSEIYMPRKINSMLKG